MYKIEFSKKVLKYLNYLPDSQYNLIIRKILLIQENPFRKDLDIKKLAGQTNIYRLRIGKVRIVFSILKDELIILIVDAGSRGDIYK